MKDILQHLYQHKTLSKTEAKTVLSNIAQGKYNNSQIASFISVYLMRSITIDELSGFRDALLNLCLPVDLSEFNTIDLCGTGGDGKNTFNISTISSFIVAGAGYKVAKHGNVGVSSPCGSSNIMEYLGYKFSNDISKLTSEVDKSGVCYLHAPLFNPAMKNVAPVRKELGLKTFFNILGPMVNPCKPKNQMVGVYNLELARLYNYLYQQTDKNYAIVFSLDGYDEISLTSDFKVISNTGEKTFSADVFKMNKIKPEELFGGETTEESAKIFLDILDCKAPQNQINVVLANSAIAIKCLNANKSLDDCLQEAKDSLYSKKAINSLQTLLKMN